MRSGLGAGKLSSICYLFLLDIRSDVKNTSIFLCSILVTTPGTPGISVHFWFILLNKCR